MTTSFRTEEDGLSGAVAFSNIDNITLKTTGPELLGVPKAPTAVVNTNTTQIATTEFVGVAVANAVATGGVQPSNASPMPDGVAVAGTSALYSRGDHVHPDSTKFVKKTGDTMTGDLYGTGFTAGSSGNQSIVGAGGVALVATTPVSGLQAQRRWQSCRPHVFLLGQPDHRYQRVRGRARQPLHDLRPWLSDAPRGERRLRQPLVQHRLRLGAEPLDR